MKAKVRNTLKKIFTVAAPLLSFGIMLSATIAAYYYVQGYRFNFESGTIRKTGVLSVESKPSRADLYVNGELIGRTPRTISSVDEGIAQVTLKREGYRDWFKNVPIKAEKSSPIYPYLLLENPEKEAMFELDEVLVKEYTNTLGNYIFFITVKDGVHTIYRYDITRNFWDLTENPKVVYRITTPIEDIDLNISPDGRVAILTTEVINPVTQVASTKIELLHTVRNGVTIEDLDLENFASAYEFTWSNDSKFIMLESVSDLVSFKVSDKTRYLLIRKSQNNPVAWTTDTEGFIYTIDREGTEEQPYFKLSQMLLDGTERTTLLASIYSQSDDKYIKDIREKPLDYIPFTNAPESTRFGGEIINIAIDQETKGFFIETSFASYWYSFEIKKYILIHPYQSKLLAFSPDKKKLLFEDVETDKVGVFTFEKEDSDHVTRVGTHIVLEEIEGVIGVNWLYNSQNLMYQKDEGINIVDIDGENDTEIIKSTGRSSIIDRRNENIFVVEQNEGVISISRFKVN